MDRSSYNERTKWGYHQETSVKTPNFRALVASKQPLPVKDYFFRRVDGVSPVKDTAWGPKTERDVAAWREFHASCMDGYYDLNVGSARGARFKSIADMHGILGNKLTQAARDFPVDLGVSLGEYRETAKLVSGAMVTTAKMYRAIRKHDFSLALKHLTGRGNKRGSDAAKAAADAWLGFTYGVKPIISDVSGAMDVLSRKGESPKVAVHTVRVSDREDVFSQINNYAGWYSGFVQGTMKGSGKLDFYVDNPLSFLLDQVGLWNPVALAWELVPYSFCVDWFIPIGDTLRGVVPPPGVSVRSGYTYVKGKGVAHRETNFAPSPPDWQTEATSKESFKDRKALFSFPSYYIRVPDLSLNYSQLASAASLMVQQLR